MHDQRTNITNRFINQHNECLIMLKVMVKLTDPQRCICIKAFIFSCEKVQHEMSNRGEMSKSCPRRMLDFAPIVAVCYV